MKPMRKLAAAALLVALATPAWAANDDVRLELPELNTKAFDVCHGAGTSSSICAMKYSSEDNALAIALGTIERCKDSDTVFSAISATYLADLAYIKQRWGY